MGKPVYPEAIGSRKSMVSEQSLFAKRGADGLSLSQKNTEVGNHRKSILSDAHEMLGISPKRAIMELIAQVVVIAIPLLTVITLASLDLFSTYSDMTDAQSVQVTINRQGRLREVIGAVQVERGISCTHLGNIANHGAQALTFQSVANKRVITQKVIGSTEANDWLTSDNVDHLPSLLLDLAVIRHQVDVALSKELTCDVEMEAYARIVHEIMYVMTDSTTLDSRAIVINKVSAHSAWQYGLEFITMLTDVGVGIHLKKEVTMQDLEHMRALRARANGLFTLAGFTTPEYGDFKANVYIRNPNASIAVSTYENMHDSMNEAVNTLPPEATAAHWLTTMNEYIEVLKQIDHELEDGLTVMLSELHDERMFDFVFIVVAVVTMLIVSVLLAFIYAAYGRRSRLRIQTIAITLSMKTEMLKIEEQKTFQLLSQIMPKSIVKKLRAGQAVFPESFDNATLLFCDIVSFTPLCAKSTAEQVVHFLNQLYSCYDRVMDLHDCYKMETIGDAVMVVSGVPLRNGEEHSMHMANVAMGLLAELDVFDIVHMPGERPLMRVALHTGPVTAGVVGHKAPRYCLFGDTVLITQRMEAAGKPMLIHTTQEFNDHLTLHHSGYHVGYRGKIEIKDVGTRPTHWLFGHDDIQLRLSVEYSEMRYEKARYMKNDSD